jgi:hypothetical protein
VSCCQEHDNLLTTLHWDSIDVVAIHFSTNPSKWEIEAVADFTRRLPPSDMSNDEIGEALELTGVST